MSAEDELALPEVPEAQPDDSEDVSWALSTAEAMWARGDHLEGIKWVRKAAEAASDTENDERALELAKAASELATLIARRSRASIGDGPGLAGGAPPEHVPPMSGQPASIQQPGSMQPGSMQPGSMQPGSAKPPSVAPNTSRMGNAPPIPPIPASAPLPSSSAPAAPGASGASQSKPPSAGVPKVGAAPGRSVPPAPIPLPSRASTAPKAPQASPAPVAGLRAPRPLATSDATQGPQAGRGILSNRVAPAAPRAAKGRRRSRENLDAEAQAAGVLETGPQSGMDGRTAETAIIARDMRDASAGGAAVERPVPDARVKRRSRPEPDPTVITNLDDLANAELAQRQKSAEEWDASPTQNLSGDEMDHMDQGDRKTAMSVPLPVVAPPPVRAPASTVHDPEIQTSQAVRVVVWRDGSGVHVAPAGTVISSITIDAVLVVLEPSADLTAWLSQRER